MTALGLVRFLTDLRASYGPEARWHELPMGVVEANRIRAERANGSSVQECTLLGGGRVIASTVPAVPTARTRRAE
jgi:hypothetical protein